MSNDKDWIDEVAKEIAKIFGPPEVHTTAMAMAQMQRIEYITKLIRSNQPQPPHMPDDVRGLAERLGLLYSSALLNHDSYKESLLPAMTKELQSFLTARAQNQTAEVVKALEQILSICNGPASNDYTVGFTREVLTTLISKLKGNQ